MRDTIGRDSRVMGNVHKCCLTGGQHTHPCLHRTCGQHCSILYSRGLQEEPRQKKYSSEPPLAQQTALDESQQVVWFLASTQQVAPWRGNIQNDAMVLVEMNYHWAARGISALGLARADLLVLIHMFGGLGVTSELHGDISQASVHWAAGGSSQITLKVSWATTKASTAASSWKKTCHQSEENEIVDGEIVPLIKSQHVDLPLPASQQVPGN